MNSETNNKKAAETETETRSDSTGNVVVMADYIARTGGRKTKEETILPSLRAKRTGTVIYLVQRRRYHHPLLSA